MADVSIMVANAHLVIAVLSGARKEEHRPRSMELLQRRLVRHGGRAEAMGPSMSQQKHHQALQNVDLVGGVQNLNAMCDRPVYSFPIVIQHSLR